MNLRNIFRLNKKPTTVGQLLDNNSVKALISDFMQDHLPEAQAIIILWATPDGDIRIAVAGGIENECTALGVLRYGEHIIINEGMGQ